MVSRVHPSALGKREPLRDGEARDERDLGFLFSVRAGGAADGGGSLQGRVTPCVDEILALHSPKRRREESQFSTPPGSPRELPLPQTPGRVRGLQSPDSIFRKALRQISSKGTLAIEGREHRVLSDRAMSGSYKNTYFFMDEEREILPGKMAGELVVKCYHERRASQVVDKALENWTAYSMNQYRTLLEHNGTVPEEEQLSIADIFNNPSEDGFFLCERLPIKWNDFTLWKDNNVTVESLPSDVRERLTNYRKFFIYAIKNNVPLDINEGNFGMRAGSNDLVLLDFLEEEEDEALPLLNTNIKKISNGNRNIFTFLLDPIKGTREYDLMMRCFET